MFGKPESGVFRGSRSFSCIIFVDRGVVMAIHVPRCDNLDVYVVRILILPNENEKIMYDGSSKWNQRVAVECVWCHKQL